MGSIPDSHIKLFKEILSDLNTILGSEEELMKYTFTIYDLNDDGYIR